MAVFWQFMDEGAESATDGIRSPRHRARSLLMIYSDCSSRSFGMMPFSVATVAFEIRPNSVSSVPVHEQSIYFHPLLHGRPDFGGSPQPPRQKNPDMLKAIIRFRPRMTSQDGLLAA
jgi:hypothetical protein